MPDYSGSSGVATTGALTIDDRFNVHVHGRRTTSDRLRGRAQARVLPPAPGADPIWARYYELKTDRPLFGDRDKSIHDDLNEISAERRNGYSWFNNAPQRALDRYATWAKIHPQR